MRGIGREREREGRGMANLIGTDLLPSRYIARKFPSVFYVTYFHFDTLDIKIISLQSLQILGLHWICV